MTRITTTVFIMLVLMNGSATIMDVSGLSEDLGVEIETGVDDRISEAVDELRNGFSPNANIVESFVGLAIAGGRVFLAVVEGIVAAPTLMINILGGGELVTTVVTVVMAPLYVISTLELLTIVIGNETI